MSLIIVEGPDGGGKTTLIQRFIHAVENKLLTYSGGKVFMGVKVFRHGPYPGETFIAHHYEKSIIWAKNNPGFLTMLDRSWISEPIYGAVKRGGEDRIGNINRQMLEQMALAEKARVIICLPSFYTCRANWQSRRPGEYLKEEVELWKVWQAYALLISPDTGTALPTHHYNYESNESVKLTTNNLWFEELL